MLLIKRAIRLFQAVWEVIWHPRSLYFVLHNEDVFRRRIRTEFPGFEKGLPVVFIEDVVSKPLPVVETYSQLGGTSPAIDIALLMGIASEIPSCSYFEIGTWRGESVVNVSRVASACYTLNLDHAQQVAKGYSREAIAAAGFYLTNRNDILRLTGDSQSFDYQSLGRTFDLVFIDGDHHAQAVATDTRKVWCHLLHDRSIVVWHDYTRDQTEVFQEVLYGILGGVPARLHGHLYHVWGTNCAIYLPVAVEARSTENRFIPHHNFKIEIKHNPLDPSVLQPTPASFEARSEKGE